MFLYTSSKKSEMTKYIKNDTALKSTAYNQTGQTFFERLSAFNSMSSHLRRVFLAKSVIDVGRKNRLRTKPKTYKLFDNHSKLFNDSCENIISNNMSYSTRSQSLDELNMSPNIKIRNMQGDYESQLFNKNDFHYLHPKVQDESFCNCKRCPLLYQNLLTKKLNQESINSLNDQETEDKKSVVGLNFSYVSKLKFAQDITNLQNFSLQQRGENVKKCSSESLANDKQYSLASSSTLPNIGYLINQNREQTIDLQQVTDSNDEEMKYINFLYDITKEIIHNRLYTDKESQDVFEKHIEKNKGILNMNKMLYEIYQLKLSLNICNDADGNNELGNVMHTQKLLSVSEISPPASPKVLEENFTFYEKAMDDQHRTINCGNKSVMSVDVNLEMLVTQRDVLTSLMEVDVKPEQAQQICKSLFQKNTSRHRGIITHKNKVG